MENSESISWDTAVKAGNFVTFEDGVPKELVLTNVQLVREPRFDNQILFQADVVEEDGKPAITQAGQLRQLRTASARLKRRLRPIFENKSAVDRVRVVIVKMGNSFDTQYTANELPLDKNVKRK
jgi:hypothetical protein